MKSIKVIICITILFSSLFVFATAKAADNCSAFPAPLPPAGSKCCISNICSDVALGEDLYLRVYAKDQDGNIIVGPPVTYTWVLGSAQLGVIESAQNSTTNGQSVAKLKIAFTANTASNKTVTVTAVYGGYSSSYIFTILATCQTNPNLYYGIGGVKKQGSDSGYQYSTAEVLSTCYDEYRLYEGDGSK